jgi:hypothetical protein
MTLLSLVIHVADAIWPDQKNLHGLKRKLLVGFKSEPTKPIGYLG